jgi:hypothetical protein
MRSWTTLFLFSVLWFLPGPAQSSQNFDDSFWYTFNEQQQVVVHLHFFWSLRCPHCIRAQPFVEELPKKFPWLAVHSYELTKNRDNVQLYLEVAKHVGAEASSVPGFVFCKTLTTGYGNEETTGAALIRMLKQCRSAHVQGLLKGGRWVPALEQPSSIHAPFIGDIDITGLSLPVLTLIIAGMDAFNPCAFFVLLFLLSLLVHARNRSRMLFIGGTFVLFSGLIYFAFMTAWLNVFLWIGELRIITIVAGLIALSMAVVNIKDYFWFQKGISLTIPEAAKPGLFKRMRDLTQARSITPMLLGTVTLAIAANFYELLCTAGFPMVYTRVLTLNDLTPETYYIYLVIYNLIYVTPLAIIVVVFSLTLGSTKLGEREGRILKLVSGLMMLGLGITLLLAPKFLNNVIAAVAILIAAIAISFLIVQSERLFKPQKKGVG